MKVVCRVLPSYGGMFWVEYCSFHVASRYNSVNDVPSYLCGGYPSSVAPIVAELDPNMKECECCGDIFIEDPRTKDPGICSIDCGYKIRGLRQ